eukprot:gene5269-6726_t
MGDARTQARMRHNHLFVLTGGPGSGKSAVIETLHSLGCARTPEAERGVIQDQVAIGGSALPWADRAVFAELMLSWDMRSHHAACAATGPVFCDRGVLDVVGYLRLVDLPVPDHIARAAERFRYNRTVFIAPPWLEIFTPDAERKQDFAEAVRTFNAMADTYRAYGYTLLELPRASVEERAKFILKATSET